jgi:FMN phosphatase YigB (HAD superfamily)
MDLWKKFHHQKLNVTDDSKIPSPPSIDTETLYWNMMNYSRLPDPWMYPALLKLKADGRFKMAALSNTTVFPPGHPLSIPDPKIPDVKALFPLFVSSAHVGMRKPNRDIYEYTLGEIRKLWGEDIRNEDVVFIDDIGENVKMARSLGIRTIKPMLGKVKDAVKELEQATGLELISEPFLIKGREVKL